eukprot:m.131596 g.131596  ORF g.131596 m.131596 type:complete len:530 (+) comp14629_c0_seq1:112-1701(+)
MFTILLTLSLAITQQNLVQGKLLAPKFGFGNEWVFQAPNTTALNNIIASSGSRMQRFPGGTPSGFWDWQRGYEKVPYWDRVLHSYCPISFPQLTTYLKETGQQSLYVPNIVTSNVTYEMQGIAAWIATETPIAGIELGNEIYDMTVPPIKARYPNASVYVQAMSTWITAIKKVPGLPSNIPIALCGGLDAAWNQVLSASSVISQVNAITQHVYTSLPEGPYTVDTAKSVFDQASVAALGTNDRLAQSNLPAHVEVWYTEIGFYGANYAQKTWLKALTMVRKLLLLSFLPQTSILLPYCLICMDPNAPAFLTTEGPYPTQSCPFSGGFVTTPTGVAETLLFTALAKNTTYMQFMEIPAPQDLMLCTLESVGVAGPALPQSGQVLNNPLECQNMCRQTDGCSRWQFVTNTKKCWLKTSNSTFQRNSGSIAGDLNCSTFFNPVVAVEITVEESQDSNFLLLNTAPLAANISTSLLQRQGIYSLNGFSVYPKSFSDLIRQNLTRNELVNSSFTVNSTVAMVTLPPYSITILKS